MTKAPESSPLRQREEAALRESEAKFRVLAETTTSAIIILQGTRLKYVNPATERLTGYSQQELLGMNFHDLFPVGKKRFMREWGRQAQHGEILSPGGEFKITTKNGDDRWIDLAAAAIEYGGKPAAIGTAFDCTERKRAEILQDAVYRIAQATDRSKRLDDIFPAVHAIIAEVMSARNYCIALKDVTSGLLMFPYRVDDRDPPVEFVEPRRDLTEYVLRTGQSLLCDTKKRKQLEQAGEIELVGTPSRVWLGVPLSIDGNVIGVMAVQDYDDPAAYGIREQRVLEFVSSQVAMAIGRKRAEDVRREVEVRIRRRADELSALYETARDIATQRDTKTLLQAIVDRAASLLNAAGGSIYLWDAEHDELELRVAHGYQGFVGKRVLPGEGLVGQVVQTLQPMSVDDYRVWEHRSPKFDAMPVTAVMAVPMSYSGELVGALSVNELSSGEGAPVRKYTGSEMEQLAFFASLAAGVVHNARLFEETRQHLVELELLYQASLSAAQIHSAQAVAQRIVDTLERLLNWNGSIWLVEDQHPVLLAHSTMGLKGQAFKEMSSRYGERITSLDVGIIGWVIKNGRALRTGNVKNNPHYVPTQEEINSELCTPLKIGDKAIGCINVESAFLDAFSKHDERLLNTLANQAAIAIENARLFEETRRRAVRQVALNAIIGASARAGTSLDEILKIALEQTLKALSLDMGAVWLSWSPRSVQRVASLGVSPSIGTLMANAAISGNISLSHTLVVNDWQNVKYGFAEMFQSMGMHSAIAVPLLSKEKQIGGLVISSTVVRHWTTEEITLVEAIGREVGLAAERAKLFEETTSRINELEAVNKVSTSLRLAQSLQGMLPHLVDETLRALDTETGGVWLYDLGQDKLRQVIGRGWCLKAAHLEMVRGENLLGSVLTSGDIYFSGDVATDSQASPDLRELAPAGWSAVCVPIRTEQETIGMFMVSAPSPREFTGEDARLLVTLTEIAGNAIHRMRLNEQTMRHAVELETRVAERTAELQAALQKAQTADRLKSEFVANINHELRTPLTNLVLYYQMLRAQPTVKMEERLDVIGRELQRLRNLIEDLLNLSRLDLGQMAFRPVLCDLNALIQTLIDDRRALAEERGLTLCDELQPDLQPVSLDEQTMVQAVSNLLTNALNYTPSGEKVLVKTMNVLDDGRPMVSFSVQDTGSGISADDLPHLFERFFRGKEAHRSGAPGTGLGLAIVKQVVDRHHGRIEVQNVPEGHGAIFTVWLPVK
jgi:PAS domain S-box-containing protein